MTKITPDDLIKRATDLLKKRYEKGGHHLVVATALLSKKGKVYAGLHLGTTQPSLAVCAEMVTLGIAVTAEKDFELDMIATVRGQNPYLISSCGRCREYIADYGPKARVVMPANNKKGWELIPIQELLPYKYAKRDVE